MPSFAGSPATRRHRARPGALVVALAAVAGLGTDAPDVQPIAAGRSTPAPAATNRLTAATAATFVTPRPAQTDDGFALTGASSYRLDPPAGAFRVTVELTATNQRRNSVLVSFGIPLLAEAASVVATTDAGAPLATRLEPIDDTVAALVLDLEPALENGASQQIRLTYDLPGLAPRTLGLTRVNGAYATLVPFAVGDPGTASVEVVVPDTYDVEIVGEDMVRAERPGEIVHRADAIADADRWFVTVDARDDGQLVSRAIEVGDHSVEVRGWPGDDLWVDFVVDHATRGIPALEDLIGLPWPVEGTLQITETLSPYLYGYAGWYSALDDTIEVGDDLVPDVVLHEVAHAWFNDDLFAERWINEAFAQEYTAHALTRMGLPLAVPEVVAAGDPGALRLVDWSTPSLAADISDDQERFGYNSSWAVLRIVSDEVGIDGLTTVVDAAAGERIAYQGDTEPERWDGPTDWRRLLDLFEERAGSVAAAELFATQVVPVADALQLVDRADARARYRELIGQGTGWSVPLAARDAMARWDFEEARLALAAGGAVIVARDGALVALGPLAPEAMTGFEERYEAEEDVDELLGAVAGVDAAVTAILAADEAAAGADDGLLARIGMVGAAPDDGVSSAVAAFADGSFDRAVGRAEATVDGVEDAARKGHRRVAGTAAIALLAALVRPLRHAQRHLTADRSVPT